MIADAAFELIDFLGTIAFAVSGAMVACQKNTDLFGVIFLSEITALGGGMTRDIILGITPPSLFTNQTGLTVALVMALVVFSLARNHHQLYMENAVIGEFAIGVIDAVGLGMFAVTGCQVAIHSGHGGNPALVLCMGMITAVGGGLLRDIILAQIPFILVKHIYALAALLGSAAYYIPHCLRCDETLSMMLGISVTFVLRCLAMRFHWNLPRPMPESGE